MRKFIARKKITLFTLFISGMLLCTSNSAQAQDDEEYYKNLLDTVVEVLNPVYKPVLSFGAGVLSFWGDVQNSVTNPINGKYGFKFNVSTLFGKNYFKGNIFATYGQLQGHNFNLTRQMQLQPLPLDDMGNPIYPNSSFQTEFWQVGITAEYGFGHLFGLIKRFKPYIAVGVSTMFFTPKGNIRYGPSNGFYYAWSDGSLRDFPENGPNAYMAQIIRLDKSYETDLSSANLYRIGSYSQNTFTIPLDLGFDFYLSDRVNFRVGATVNYAFSDMLDNYSSKTVSTMGYPSKNSYNDIFTFTYFSMNLDLFSDPKTMLVERVFAELSGTFDYGVFFADQDGDNVLDRFDACPDTPPGVAVDSLGCPPDYDNDGVFDYMDDEPNTPEGAIVNERGVQLSADALSDMYSKNSMAVPRSEVKVIPLANVWTRNVTFTPGAIPDKFRIVDADADGYISFQELLKAINDFFDEKNTFTPDEIYELNEYFFSQ